MALREETSGQTSSAIAGLPIFWGDAAKAPPLELEKRTDLFEVALMAKSNKSVAELTKTTGTKDKNLMGNMEEAVATKKAISVVYQSLGMAARKTLLKKLTTLNVTTVTLNYVIKNCKDCFEKPKNETLDCFKFLS